MPPNRTPIRAPVVRTGWGTPMGQRRNNVENLERAIRRIMNMNHLTNNNRTNLNAALANLGRRGNRNLVARARMALRSHNNYNSNAGSVRMMPGLNFRPNMNRNKAAVKIQAALRGWLARSKHLPKNKFTLVIGPNGVPMVAVKPTRLGMSVAKKAANMKEYNRYMARLRGM